MSLGYGSRVRLGSRYHGDFGQQIRYARRLPPGPPLEESKPDPWWERLARWCVRWVLGVK
jgi:hypothetical protein